MEVTQELLIKACFSSPCELPQVGTPIEKLTQSQLFWVEDKEIAKGKELPLWAYSGDGDGDGYGDGYGGKYLLKTIWGILGGG